MTWHDYSMNFYKTAEIGELTSRRVYNTEFYFGPRPKIQGVTERQDEPVLQLCGIGHRSSVDYVLVPETRAEFEIYKADLIRQIEEVDERIKCLDENKVDRVDPKSFKIWKLIKTIKEEKDDTKLKQLLSESIKN